MSVPVPQFMSAVPKGAGRDNSLAYQQQAMQLMALEQDPMFRQMNTAAAVIKKYADDPTSINDKDYVEYVKPAIGALGLNEKTVAKQVGDEAGDFRKFAAGLFGTLDSIALGFIPDNWYSSRRTQSAAQKGQWLGIGLSVLLGGKGLLQGAFKASKGGTSLFKKEIADKLATSPLTQGIMQSPNAKRLVDQVSKSSHKLLRSDAMKYTMPGLMYRGGQRVAGHVTRLANQGVGWAQKAKPFLKGGATAEAKELAAQAARIAGQGRTDDAIEMLRKATQTGGANVVQGVTKGMKGLQKDIVKEAIKGVKPSGPDEALIANLAKTLMGYKKVGGATVRNIDNWLKSLPKLLDEGKTPKQIVRALGLKGSKAKALEANLKDPDTRKQILDAIRGAGGEVKGWDYIKGLAGPSGGIATGVAGGAVAMSLKPTRTKESNPFSKNYRGY